MILLVYIFENFVLFCLIVKNLKWINEGKVKWFILFYF